ncbi:MAG: cobalamin-dependent protein, partial [SAR324 cluster bacterium]|nr:cobalamin-dependent protein [SAR324 cluster bacterium]
MESTEPNIPIRFVTSTSLFDGHDASINIVRRILQREGAEVIHLGHNRSVREIVDTAVQEDAQGIAISSYQGGHVEYFKYMVDLLREGDSGHIRIFGGGGGVIVREEIAELEAYGVAKVYSVEDGQRMGLVGMIRDMLAKSAQRPEVDYPRELERLPERQPQALARCLTFVELAALGLAQEEAVKYFDTAMAKLAGDHTPVVLGVTGTGGAGKSSLADEVLRRFLADFPERTVAILSIDPSMRRTGGALLGDRIRMNAVSGPHVYMRSIATRQGDLALAKGVAQAVAVCRAARFDLIVVETAGIGQSDTGIVDLVDFSLYVMTPEYGAPSQLEKIAMLHYADMIAINKAEKRGAHEALRDVKKQVRRNREWFDVPDEALPVYPTIASRYGDPATDTFYRALMGALHEKHGADWLDAGTAHSVGGQPAALGIPDNRVRYLSEVADAVRNYKRSAEEQAGRAARAHGLLRALETLGAAVPEGPEPLPEPPGEAGGESAAATESPARAELAERYHEELEGIDPEGRGALVRFDSLKREYTAEQFTFRVRGREIRVDNYEETLSHLKVPKVVMPRFRDWGDRLRWLLLENVPGAFPFTAGFFPFKHAEEDPTRMFA